MAFSQSQGDPIGVGNNDGINSSTVSSARNLAPALVRPLLMHSNNNDAASTGKRSNDYSVNTTATATSSSDDNVPTNVSEPNQLADLPEECLSGDPVRPLQHFDEDGKVCYYALNPMVYSVFMILLMEGIERFAFYGINYTQTSYLTGSYDRDWNAGMDAIPASSVRTELHCAALLATGGLSVSRVLTVLSWAN